MNTSEYIVDQRYSYSLYVMQSRAIPAATDGLKAGGRRALFTARDGKKYKTATLAGATMPLHPHSECSGAINTLAAPYGNNIPLFEGEGAFGTLLDPTAYGASRYTSVRVSKFTEDVIFRDIEIIPMIDNYDGTLLEPEHFLPLVPVVLLNPSEGIAVGFATNILPRSLGDIISTQIAYLKNSKKPPTPQPHFVPLNNKSHNSTEVGKGVAYYFRGEYVDVNATTIRIDKLPYGMQHDKILTCLDSLNESGTVVNFEDLSRDVIDISVQFKRGFLSNTPREDVLNLLGLEIRHVENLNVLDFSGQTIWSPTPQELIHNFTEWRLEWFVARYERLKRMLLQDLQRYYDMRVAIKNNIGAVARKVESRVELKEYLSEISIVNVDYIADLPVYRFTEEEHKKNEARIAADEKQLVTYNTLLANDGERKMVYIQELEEILHKYKKGEYA